jgi:hypothetical protein
VQGRDVRLEDLGLAGELLGEETLGGLEVAVVEPAQQAESEHVLGPLGVLLAEVVAAERLHGQRGQGHRVHGVVRQCAVLERIVREADLRQVAFGELVGVDDDLRAGLEQSQAGHECGRVHRDEHVGGVAGSEDVVVGEVQLERAHAGQRALRGADLGGEVRQGRQVVAVGS